MSLPEALIDELWTQWTPWVVLAVLVGLVAVRQSPQRRGRFSLALLAIHLLLLLATAIVHWLGVASVSDVRLVSATAGMLAGLTAAGAVVFRVGLPRVGIRSPQIVEDVTVGTFALMSFYFMASRSGLEISGLVATSAVATAVIGLALQDTIGNIFGGLALQTDDSIHVGDWIKIGDLSGRVVQMRWRYTAVETRNWETVVVPNAQLLKNQVVVLGRRTGQPVKWRRWVWFNIDHRTPPAEVIAAVEAAVRGAPIPNVASEPGPSCVVMEFADSYARYALRYWLTDLAVDDPTDSLVRQRIYTALKRANVSLALPAHAVFMTKEGERRHADLARTEIERRVAAISSVELFRRLPEEDLRELASALHYVPFAKGEVLTRQGAKAHWLYVVQRGTCSVRVEVDGAEREVSKIADGEIFGEMSLLTGAERAATVVADSEVECWRLDRSAFQSLLQRRPDVAEDCAEILAQRRVALESIKEDLTDAVKATRVVREKTDMLDKIRALFGLDGPESLPPSR